MPQVTSGPTRRPPKGTPPFPYRIRPLQQEGKPAERLSASGVALRETQNADDIDTIEDRFPGVVGIGCVIFNLEIASERVAVVYPETGIELKDRAKDAIGRELERIIAVFSLEIHHPKSDRRACIVGWDEGGGERPKRNPSELYNFMAIRIDDEL